MRTEKQAEKIAEKILNYTKTYQTTKIIKYLLYKKLILVII